MDPKLRKLVVWIGENMWRESRALYPDPTNHVHVHDLLDQIHDIFEVSAEDIDAAFVKGQDKRAAARKARR